MEMTYAEIISKIEELKLKAEEAKRNEIKEIISQIKKHIKNYDLTAEDLGFSSTKKTEKNQKQPKVVMYRKGNLTWSGSARGRKPKWVIEAEQSGENIEQYRV